jgi:hypothetical protein
VEEAPPADVAVSSDTGLTLESGSPDALCPDLRTTQQAVRRRLGTLVAPPGPGWKARYTIGHAPEGAPRDFVRLELFGPDGNVQLSRDLPLDAACATMADVIALVLDRHFRGLPHEDPAATSVPPPVDAPSPPAVAPAPVASLTHEPQRLIFVAVEGGAQRSAGPVLGLRAMGEVVQHLYVGAALSWGLGVRSERLSSSAEVEARSLSAEAYVAGGVRFAGLHCYLGPGVRFTLDSGSAHGLPEAYSGERAVFALGGHAGLVWAAPHLVLTLTGSVDHAFEQLSGQFQIDGREVLEPQALGLRLGLGVGYAF